MATTGIPPGITAEQRELLLFDALRVALGIVHGAEREQVQQSLRTAGLIHHLAADGCENWIWPGSEPLGACRHGYPFRPKEVGVARSTDEARGSSLGPCQHSLAYGKETSK